MSPANLTADEAAYIRRLMDHKAERLQTAIDDRQRIMRDHQLNPKQRAGVEARLKAYQAERSLALSIRAKMADKR